MKQFESFTTSNEKKLLVVLPITKIEEVHLNECAHSLSKQETNIDVLILAKNLDLNNIEKIKNIFTKPEIIIRKQDDKGAMVEEKIVSEKGVNFVIENTEANSFSEFFNEAFNYADINGYDWVSPIEQYDILDFKWYENFIKFEKEKQDVGIFLPITREIANGFFISFFNEVSWAEGFAEVAGYTDLNLLLRMNCVNLVGSCIKIEHLKGYSEKDEKGFLKPIKESMKLGYIHEFFLRMIYNDVKVFTIPRLGYERIVVSNFDYTQKLTTKVPIDLIHRKKEEGGMNESEARFWLELSKKEYFFDNDRKEIYIEEPKIITA